jgi:endo-1,4-beta-xylanase
VGSSSSSGSGSSSGARADAGGGSSGSSSSSGGSADGGSSGCGVPTSFKWSSTGPIIAPISDATHNLTAIKDPTVVFFNNRWNIYASTTDNNGNYNSAYLNFTDWNSAGSAPQTYLTGGVAPEVFYFAPQNLWYRIYEWPDVYSTSTDPTQPQSWSAGKNFYSTEPAIVTQNGGSVGWIDFWVACNDTTCFLFFSDDNGNFYRAQTPIGSFPNGFSQPVIAMSDTPAGRLFEASNVYSMKGTGQYLLLVEAYDSNSGGRRYFRSWTASALDGAWTPLQAEYATPFASATNVTFSGTAWTQDISHGEMLRSGYDQKLEIDTCNLQYVYQGKDPSASGTYNTLPWRLGLLTETN